MLTLKYDLISTRIMKKLGISTTTSDLQYYLDLPSIKVIEFQRSFLGCTYRNSMFQKSRSSGEARYTTSNYHHLREKHLNNRKILFLTKFTQNFTCNFKNNSIEMLSFELWPQKPRLSIKFGFKF